MSKTNHAASKVEAQVLVPHDMIHVEGDHTYDFATRIALADYDTEGNQSNEDARMLPILRVNLTDTYEEKGAVWTRLKVAHLNGSQEESFVPLIGPLRVNLMNHTRAGLKGVIEELAEMRPEYNWERLFGEIKAMTFAAIDEAIPRVSLAEAALQRKARPPYLLKPFVASSGVSVFYGDGGTGKSVLSLVMALEVSTGAVIISDQRSFQTGPVIYADYEDEHDEHANRLAAICRGQGIELEEVEIEHMALVGKVATEAKRLRQAVYDTKAKLIILDSIGMGRGGDALGPEDTIRMFRALRGLGCPVLAIDHVSKESKSRKSSPDPYGSIYTRNSSRMAWHVEQRAPRLGDPWEYLVFTHTKANHVRRQAPRYLKVRYVNALAETGDGEAVEMVHSITYEQTDVAGLPEAPPKKGEEPEKRITLLDEIEAALFTADAPMTVRELSDNLGRGEGTIRKTCHRGVEQGRLVADGDGYTLPDEKPIPW